MKYTHIAYLTSKQFLALLLILVTFGLALFLSKKSHAQQKEPLRLENSAADQARLAKRMASLSNVGGYEVPILKDGENLVTLMSGVSSEMATSIAFDMNLRPAVESLITGSLNISSLTFKPDDSPNDIAVKYFLQSIKDRVLARSGYVFTRYSYDNTIIQGDRLIVGGTCGEFRPSDVQARNGVRGKNDYVVAMELQPARKLVDGVWGKWVEKLTIGSFTISIDSETCKVRDEGKRPSLSFVDFDWVPDEKAVLEIKSLNQAELKLRGSRYMSIAAHFWNDKDGKGKLNAVRFFEMAALAGHPPGQYNYGLCLINGIARQSDPKAGIDLVEKAATGGFAPAMTLMGRAHSLGSVVPLDHQKAERYLSQALENGDQAALYPLTELLWGFHKPTPVIGDVKKFKPSEVRTDLTPKIRRVLENCITLIDAGEMRAQAILAEAHREHLIYAPKSGGITSSYARNIPNWTDTASTVHDWNLPDDNTVQIICSAELISNNANLLTQADTNSPSRHKAAEPARAANTGTIRPGFSITKNTLSRQAGNSDAWIEAFNIFGQPGVKNEAFQEQQLAMLSDLADVLELELLSEVGFAAIKSKLEVLADAGVLQATDVLLKKYFLCSERSEYEIFRPLLDVHDLNAMERRLRFAAHNGNREAAFLLACLLIETKTKPEPPPATSQVGLVAAEKVGSPSRIEEARNLLQSEFRLGRCEAAVRLCVLDYAESQAEQSDTERKTKLAARSRDWASRAADKGETLGFYLYGRMLIEGVGGPSNTLLGQEKLVRAVKGGKKVDLPALSAQAMVGVGGIAGIEGNWYINFVINTHATFNCFRLIDGKTGQEKGVYYRSDSRHYVAEPGNKCEFCLKGWFDNRTEAGDRIELYNSDGRILLFAVVVPGQACPLGRLPELDLCVTRYFPGSGFVPQPVPTVNPAFVQRPLPYWSSPAPNRAPKTNRKSFSFQ